MTLCRILVKRFGKSEVDVEASVTYTLPLEVAGQHECLGSDELSSSSPTPGQCLPEVRPRMRNTYRPLRMGTLKGITMKKEREEHFERTFLEWRAEGLVLCCSEFVTSGLCSGEQFHKVTGTHWNAAKGEKSTIFTIKCMRSQIYNKKGENA